MSRSSMSLRAGVGLVALVVGGAASAQASQPASAAPSAQEASPTDIVVTGSRIRRDPLAQDSPIVFVDKADIDKTGLNSLNDVLQRLPSSGGGLNGKFNNSGNFGNPPDGGGVGAGSAEIDLRYLQSKRTLVLVDGLRYVPGASASGVPGSVDLNSIPESMIERVEVLQEGASSIYGSDAIAGVVNIITKHQQKGFAASAQLGTMTQGDGGSQNYQLSWGNGGDSAIKVVAGVNWVKQDSISSGDRDISLFPAPYSTTCLDGGCSSGTPLGRFVVGGNDLTLIAPVIGRAPVLADYRDWAGAADRFNFAPYNYIQIPLKRYGGFVSATADIGPDTHFSVKALYNRRNSRNQAAPLPLFVGPDAGNGNMLDRIVIDSTNPYNPFGTLQGDDPTTPLVNEATYAFIGRRVIEGGPRRYFQKVSTKYLTATLDGKLGLGGSDWYWDVNAVVGRNKAEQTMLGNINAAKLQQALGPVASCTAPCVPFNLFGGVGSITPAMLDFVGFTQHDSSQQKMWDVSANLTGSLFDLPGGPVGVAVGVEHRDTRGRFDPDPVVAAGLGSDIPALPTSGGYNVDEGYAEVRAPLLADVPGAQLLEFNGAVRYTNYSTTAGSKTTFKAGANWKPIKDLRLRASWAQGFRGPTVGELYGTPSRFDQEIADPCSGLTLSSNATLLANCTAQGVPAPTAGGTSYTQLNPQLSVVTGGNGALKPETSKSLVIGGVVSPASMPRFSVEVNWYKIKVNNAIQAINANVTLQRCALNNDPAACALVTRSSSGQVTQIRGLLDNIAGIRTKGFDINVAYRTPDLGFGTIGLNWNSNWLRQYDLIVPSTGGNSVIHRLGTEQGSPDQAFPKWKSNATVDITGHAIAWSLTGRYIGSVVESEAGGNKMDSRFYVDTQLRFISPSFAKNFEFALGANNLFDKDPPGCISCGLNNFDPTTYDVPGRYVYARASVKM